MATDQAAPAIQPPSLLSNAAHFLAVGFGAGYSPFAPGTAGTVVGLVLFWPLRGVGLVPQLVAMALMFLAAVASAEVTSRRTGIKDPSIVVVDEIIGMWISLFLLPWTPAVVIAAFFLFRLMDVVKPPPARGFERLPGGWGIVLDDVMAGIYANLAVRVGLWIWATL
jgi:phosphatidylglycerophosphatase A